MKANKRLTLCLPYYRNAGMLREQFRRLRNLPEVVKRHLEVIVVDDGSPDGQAQGEEIGCPLRLYRIAVDIRWNQDAARNIAAHHARTDWLLLTDIDHLVPPETFEGVMAGKLDPRRVYRFGRVTWSVDEGGRHSLTPYKPHPNSWLMTRAIYDRMGGYDERFAGLYGTDSDFRDRVLGHIGEPTLLDHVLIRVPRETVPDASTTTYARKVAGLDGEGIQRVKRERAMLGSWETKRLSFPYKQIYP